MRKCPENSTLNLCQSRGVLQWTLNNSSTSSTETPLKKKEKDTEGAAVAPRPQATITTSTEQKAAGGSTALNAGHAEPEKEKKSIPPPEAKTIEEAPDSQESACSWMESNDDTDNVEAMEMSALVTGNWSLEGKSQPLVSQEQSAQVLGADQPGRHQAALCSPSSSCRPAHGTRAAAAKTRCREERTAFILSSSRYEIQL
jgi:hypothetical protein